MTTLSPAEQHAQQGLTTRYPEAYKHLLGEAETALALVVPTSADLVAARFAELTSTPEARARFAAYLDGLESPPRIHPATAAYIAASRLALATAGGAA